MNTSKIFVNSDGELIYISQGLVTHIMGFIGEEAWWFYVKF